MNIQQSVKRDERTVVIENVGYKWACIFMMFALLLDGSYRGLFHNEAAWDLLALAIVPSLACTIYQARHKTLASGWLKTALLLAFIGGIIGFVIAFIFIMIRTK
jgi:hypothetical protein